jgi:hypothetical protein
LPRLAMRMRPLTSNRFLPRHQRTTL